MMHTMVNEMNTVKKLKNVNKSSKSEAPYKLAQQINAIYTTMSASVSKEETKVIPPDCFF
jgi:uncharacterized FlaG/YvyC family protein